MEQQNEVKVASLLELETLEKGLYRGQSWDLGFRALFGGQVLGQALKAAWASVPEGRVAHVACRLSLSRASTFVAHIGLFG